MIGRAVGRGSTPTPALRSAAPPVLPTAAPSLLLGALFVKLTHFDWRPTSDGGLAPPCYRLVQVSGLQYPETAHVLLGLQVRPVGDQPLTPGQAPQRLRAACRQQAASEKPGASSRHLFVEHVDIAAHCFVLDGRVVVIRVVNRYQKLLHVFFPM